MDLRLAGVFVKRVCVMGSPVPGEGPGNTTTPTICDSEPTTLLVVIVAGAFAVLLALIALLAIAVAVRRRPVERAVASAPPTVALSVPRAAIADGNSGSRSWRDIYRRMLDFVDKAMADVGRTMPDERSMPVSPPRFENEQSGTLAAELTVLGSAHVHAAHAAWANALFQFYLLARDVAEAHAKNLAESQYRHEVVELRKTRATVFELADALRRQATQELRA